MANKKPIRRQQKKMKKFQGKRENAIVPRISKEKDTSFREKKRGRIKKDKTCERTVTRIYYSAREKVKVSKEKYVVFILMFIAIFTLYFNFNTLSRYAGTAQGNGSIQVAKWDVGIEDSLNSKIVNIVSGNSESYVLQVKSASETANNYSINLSNIPNDIQVQLDGGTTKSPTSGIVSFENVGTFNANSSGQTRNHTLTFISSLNTVAVTNCNIDIDVIFVQEEI